MHATIKGLELRMNAIFHTINSWKWCIDRIIAIRKNHAKIHAENETFFIGK
jgi:hypothetical protein